MSDDAKCKDGDTLLLGPVVSDNGTRACIRHLPDHRVGVGFMRPLRDGQPIHGGEVVSLKHVEENRYAVTSLYGSPVPHEDTPAADEAQGPARVTTEAYREGWDRIFGPREIGQA